MKRYCMIIAGGLITLSASADIKLPALFSHGMVFQRETIAPMWGWAEPSEKVRVSTSWGAKAATTTSTDGTWQVVLKTPAAGGPFDVTVQGNNTTTLTNVLSGEVWFCGGQSNMDFPMQRIAEKAKEARYQPVADYVRNEMETANDPLLRHIEVPRNASASEKKYTLKGSWHPVAPENTSKITATGYFFARELRRTLNVPVGLVECSWSGTRIQPWLSADAYRSDPTKAAYYNEQVAILKKQTQAWDPEEANTKYKNALKDWEAGDRKRWKPQPPRHPEKNQSFPAALHNGMVSAVVPFAIRGVIWYQGESNAGYMNNLYEDYFSTLIQSWRREWNRGDFPFYWAQLSAYEEPNVEPVDQDGWANVCDQQRRCLKLPNTGMAVLNDIGEIKDIHPRNKVDVGKRLALWALANDYGIELPAFSGPLYKGSEIKGSKVLIAFDHTGSGLMTGHKELLEATVETDAPLQRFQITGADRVWKWANAKIIAKDIVEVSHPEIARPIAVRYAWSKNPHGANLYNKEGLPASTFTTEVF